MAQIQSAGGVLRRLPTLFAVYRASDGVSATKRSTQRKMRMAPVEVTCGEPPCITLTPVNAHVHTYMIPPSHQSPSIFLSIYTYVYFLCHHYHSGAISAAMFGQDPVQAHLRRRSEACSDIGTDGPMESKTALA